MITRYSREEMASIWELDKKFQYYLDVELAVIKAQVELGNFDEEVYENIKKTAKFDVKRIDEIERVTRHDVIAFLENVNENVGRKFSPYIHKGLTSSDVIDTAFALQIKDSSKIINKDLDELIEVVKELAFKHPELDDCDKSKKIQIKDEQREIDQAKLHSSLGQTDNS